MKKVLIVMPYVKRSCPVSKGFRESRVRTPYTVRAGSRVDELPFGSSLSEIMKTRLLPASFVPLPLAPKAHTKHLITHASRKRKLQVTKTSAMLSSDVSSAAGNASEMA